MTPHNDCHQLDAYLAGDLPANDADRYELHLETCAECREAVDEQKWIDSLLQSPTRIQLERVPTEILESFRSSLPPRRQTWQAACGLATAAALVIAVGWSYLTQQPTMPTTSQTPNIAATKPAYPSPPSKPQATFVASPDSIAVQLESPSDEVTIVQVYPTTDAERRWHLEATLSTDL